MDHSKSTDYKPQWEGWLRQNQVSVALFLLTLPILGGLHSSENTKVEEEVWPQGSEPGLQRVGWVACVLWSSLIPEAHLSGPITVCVFWFHWRR